MKDYLLKIIGHYGLRTQLKYFQSEVFELNEAIISESFGEDHIEHIAEEIADVLVMLKQFQLFFDIKDNDVKNIMNEKIKRQIVRIENEGC